jgi:hypothetical protein
MGLTPRNYDHDSSELWDRHSEIMTMTPRNYDHDSSELWDRHSGIMTMTTRNYEIDIAKLNPPGRFVPVSRSMLCVVD